MSIHNAAGVGTNSWTSPANAVGGDNATYASISPARNVYIGGQWTFDFSAIPAGATINSLTWRFQRKETGTANVRYRSQVYVGGVGVGTLQDSGAAAGSTTERFLGSYTCDAALSRADLDSLTLFIEGTRTTTTANTLQLDYLEVVVDYSTGVARDLAVIGTAATKASGDLTVMAPPVDLAGSGSATLAAGASLGTLRSLTGSTAGATGTAGDLTVTAPGGQPRALDGVLRAATKGQGIVGAARALAGSGAASSAGNGTSRVSRQLQSTARAAAGASGSLTVQAPGVVSMAGASRAATKATGALRSTRRIAGSARATTKGSGSLTVGPASGIILQHSSGRYHDPDDHWYLPVIAVETGEHERGKSRPHRGRG